MQGLLNQFKLDKADFHSNWLFMEHVLKLILSGISVKTAEYTVHPLNETKVKAKSKKKHLKKEEIIRYIGRMKGPISLICS